MIRYLRTLPPCLHDSSYIYMCVCVCSFDKHSLINSIGQYIYIHTTLYIETRVWERGNTSRLLIDLQPPPFRFNIWFYNVARERERENENRGCSYRENIIDRERMREKVIFIYIYIYQTAVRTDGRTTHRGEEKNREGIIFGRDVNWSRGPF